MFLIRSHPRQPAGRTLNAIAIPDRQTRRDRRLHRCDRLAEMAMHLTETAYSQALRDAQPPPEPPCAMPGPRPAYMPPPKAAYDRTLASNFFQEFSRCARQAILLEARLDSGIYDNAPAIPAFTERASPRHEARHHAPTGPRQPSDETRLHYERLEDEFADDGSSEPDELLQTIENHLQTAIAGTRATTSEPTRRADASPPPRATTPAQGENPEPPRPAPPPRPKPTGKTIHHATRRW